MLMVSQARFLMSSSRRRARKLSTAFMISSVTILYAAAVVHFSVQVAYSVGYGRLLNDAVAAVSSQDPASSIDMPAALVRFEKGTKVQSHIVTLVLATIVSFMVHLRVACIVAFLTIYVRSRLGIPSSGGGFASYSEERLYSLWEQF